MHIIVLVEVFRPCDNRLVKHKRRLTERQRHDDPMRIALSSFSELTFDVEVRRHSFLSDGHPLPHRETTPPSCTGENRNAAAGKHRQRREAVAAMRT